MRNQLAIDLGGANLLAASVGEGIIVQEPSVIAISKTDGKVLAVGHSAEQKLNIRDASVGGVRPFGEGLIANPDVTAEVLSRCLASAGYNRALGGDLLLAVPCDFTNAQEDLLVTVAESLGVTSCYLMYSPLAAVISSYDQIPEACLAVDIGANKTNILLICRGRIYYMKSIDVAGAAFDRAIADYVQRKRRVRISLRTAEEVKTRVGTVWSSPENRSVEVTGKDANGRLVSVRVSASEMYEALEDPMSRILEAICVAVSKVPIHSVNQVFDLGISLSGGGACLDGIEKMISGVTGVATHLVSDPAGATANGLADAYQLLPHDIPKNLHNISEFVMKRVFATR